MTWSVYVVTNRVNGMQYVGQTMLHPAARWGHHLTDAFGRQRRPMWPLGKAIHDYGVNEFTLEIRSTHSTRKAALAEEKRLMIELKTVEPHGYNVLMSTIWARRSRNERAAIAKKGNASRTPETRRSAAIKSAAAFTTEERSIRAKRALARKSRWELSARARKGVASQTRAQRSAAAREAHRNRGGTIRDPRQSSFLP